ncbi:MAG: hypothetical protein ABIH38_03195 [Patescibacteria group bacterium]
MPVEKKSINKKILASSFLLLFFISFVFLFLLAFEPRPANAVGGVVSAPVLEGQGFWQKAWAQAQKAFDKVKEKAKEAFTVATDVAFKNSLRTFLGRVVQDTAVWIASAGTGQKPLFMTDPHYWTKLSQASAGDFLYSMGEEVFGIDVCAGQLPTQMALTMVIGDLISDNPLDYCNRKCEIVNKPAVDDLRYNLMAIDPKTGKASMIIPYSSIPYLTALDNDNEGSLRVLDNIDRHSDGYFPCPIACEQGPGLSTPPGVYCQPTGYYTDEERDKWTKIPLTRENLQLCIATVQRFYINEMKGLQSELQICLKNCKGGIRTSRCTANEIFKNFAKVTDAKNGVLANQKLVGGTINLYLESEQNDIGKVLKVLNLEEIKTQKDYSAAQVIASSDSVSSLTDKLGVSIIAPRESVQNRLEDTQSAATRPEEVRTGSLKADLITIFTNTLIDRLTQRFFGGKCALNPSAAGCKGPSGGSKLSQLVFGSVQPSGVAAAKLQFASISKLNFTLGSPGQDPVSAGDLTARGIIDSGFQTAIDQELSVKQAIEKGLIGGTFGFDAEGREPSLNSGISYRSIVYLRTYRVVPVGWELAAKWIKDHPQNITLQKLIEEAERCESGGKKYCSNDKSISCGGDSDCYDTTLYPSCDDNSDCDAGQICTIQADGGRKACYDACDLTTPVCPEGFVCRETPDQIVGHCVGEAEPYCQAEANASPFCGLIDPNWVLKLPETYCQKRGVGEEIQLKQYICDEDTNGDNKTDCKYDPTTNITPDIGHWEISRNSDVCVNEQSCLQQDSQGKCLKYGYCFEERPVWKFNGDACDRQYASCQSYKASDGSVVSYLKKTLDINGCTAANAGCQWYCQEPDFDTTTNQWTCTKTTGNKIHFDRDVKECAENNVGCQEFIPTGNHTNLVPNSSFEYYTGEVDNNVSNNFTDIIVENTCGATAEAVSDAYTGSIALKLRELPSCGPGDSGQYLATDQIDTGYPVLNRTFTYSIYAKATAATTTSRLVVKNGGVGFFPDYLVSMPISLTTEWQRFSTTFTVDHITLDGGGNPVSPNSLILIVRASDPVAGVAVDVYVDAMQLEENTLSAYKDYGKTNQIYLNSNRIACEEKDVGCEKYTPVKGKGAAIPGVVYPSNLCSADKVGCQPFREEPILSIPERPERDPVYFIGGSGQRCEVASVGCEEYTNLDIVAKGGEGKAYYTKIRQCVKPEAAEINTFYTWEGSDTRGYQLTAYRLKKSNTSNAPCTNLSVPNVGADPVCIDNLTVCAGGDNIGDVCINDGQCPGSTCSDIKEVAACTAAEMEINPDCTEYYDTAGNVYYILRSRVIKASAECYPHRNTIDSIAGKTKIFYLIPSESISCPAKAAGCREYKGNTGSVSRKVFQATFEDTTLGATEWQAGSISNESLRATEHSLHVAGNSTATSVVDPAVLKEKKLVSGQYYQLSFWLKPDGAGTTTINNAVIQNNNGVPDNIISFISGPVSVTQDWNQYVLGPLVFDRDMMDFDQIALELNGPFYIDNVLLEEVADVSYIIKNTFTSCGAGDLNCQAYKDTKNAIHYIKSFDHLCPIQFIGCAAMINTQNYHNPFATVVRGITIPADSFETVVYDKAKTCPASAKGCQSFGLPALNQIDEPVSWETKFLLNDPEKYQYTDEKGNDVSIVCLAAEDGCAEYAYTNGGGTSWFKDPRSKTCEYKLGSGGGEYQWFKLGTNLLCPYVTPPPEKIPTGRACVKVCASGAFADVACVDNSDCRYCLGGERDGTTCSDNAGCPGGVCVAPLCGGGVMNVGAACTSNAQCTGTTACDYWAGLCPEEQSGCNEYRDPSDPASCRTGCALVEENGVTVPVDESCQPTVCQGGDRNGQMCNNDLDCPGGNCSATGLPGCRSYYYIKDMAEENKEECANQVNQAEGCMPFNDTSNPVLNMRGK